ncbi:MAG: hypothetical protein ACTH2U_11145 [Brevibacterium sp.]
MLDTVSGTLKVVVPIVGSVDSVGKPIKGADPFRPKSLPHVLNQTVYLTSNGGTPTAVNRLILKTTLSNDPITLNEQVPIEVITAGGTHKIDSVPGTVAQVLNAYAAGGLIEWMSLTLEVTLPKTKGNVFDFGAISLTAQVNSTGIADNSITETKVLDDSISTPKLQANAVTADKVSANAITAGKIAANAIEAGKIKAGAITTDHLQSKIITGDKIAVGAITASSGIIGSIDARTITAGTIAAARFAANTINADSVLVNGSLGSTIIKDGAITTSKIKAGAITADSGIIGSINAGTITVGEMDGARIKASTVSADKLLVGTGGNLIPWGQVARGESLDPHYQYGSGAIAMEAANTALGIPPHMRVSNSSASGVQLSASFRPAPGLNFQSSPGSKYTFKVKAYALSGDTVQAQVRIYWYTNPAAGSGYINSGGSTNVTLSRDGLTEVSVTATAPARAAYALPFISVTAGSAVGVVEADFRSQVGATLIEGGAISTEHIRTGAITAESGIIGSIDANVITSGKIMGNQIDADALNGKTITGATIRTASSGSRVELTQNGLKQYNSRGATIVDMTSGSFSLAGGSITGSTIKTATSGSRVEINTQGLKQYNASNEVIAEMVAGSMVMRGVLEQSNSQATMQVGPSWSSLSPGIRWDNVPSHSWDAGIAVNGSSGNMIVQGPGKGKDGAALNLSNDKVWLGSRAAGRSTLDLSNSLAYLQARDSSDAVVGALWMDAADGVILSANARSLALWGNEKQILGSSSDSTGPYVHSPAARDRTYSGTGNGHVTVNGVIGRISSSIRYKTAVEDFEPDSTVLDVQPRTWLDRAEVSRWEGANAARQELGQGPLPAEYAEADEPRRYFGAIAEEVDELGLDHLVVYDAFGQPESLAYDRFAIALIPIVREQRDRIERLEAQLTS